MALYSVGGFSENRYKQRIERGRVKYEIDQRYRQTLQRGRGQDRVLVEARSPVEAFTIALAEQSHPVSTRVNGLRFIGYVLGLSDDVRFKDLPRPEKERLVSRFVSPAPEGAKPDYVFTNRHGDSVQVSPEAREAAKTLLAAKGKNNPTNEEVERGARIVEAMSAYTQRQRARGILTPIQEDLDKAQRIKEMRARQAERGDQPRKLTYFGDEEKPKDVPKDPAKPKPVQGTLFDMTPRGYLGERLNTSG